MDKADYIILKKKYFEATASEKEESILKDFAARTDDPDFNDVKAAFSYYAVGRNVHSCHQPQTPFWYRMAAAAILLLIVVTGIRLYKRQQCYSIAYGERVTDRTLVIQTMESTLTDIFSSGIDVKSELSCFFNEDNL